MKAKIIASVLAALIALSALAAVPAFAEGEELISGNFKYTVADDSATVVKYFGLDSELEIPAEFDGVPVTAIGDLAFAACSSLESVTIPSGVKSIGNDAFYRCALLKSVSIPAGVTFVGEHSFDTCTSLSDISLPGSVTLIGEYAFAGCTSLKWIEVPSAVDLLGKAAFSGCTSLKRITVGSANKTYKAIGGAVYTADGTTLVACPGAKKSVTLPDTLTAIGDFAFLGCSVTEVNYPRSAEEWSRIATGSGNDVLTSANIVYDYVEPQDDVGTPDGPGADKVVVETSGDFEYTAENGAAVITRYTGSGGELSIPGDLGGVPVREIGESAFSGCASVTGVTIPSGVTVIGANAFWGCTSLASVTIPDSVEEIGDGAFVSCASLSAFVVSAGSASFKAIDGILYTKDGATLLACPAGIAQTALAVPDGVTAIGDLAFCYCEPLTAVTLPSGLKTVGDGAFYGCASLAQIAIPDSVTAIGANAFRGCAALASVTLPSALTQIGEYAFSSCHSLRNVNYTGSEEAWGKIALGEHNEPLASATVVYDYVPPVDPTVADGDAAEEEGSDDFRALLPFAIGIAVVALIGVLIVIIRKRREY